ncbi:MAG: stage 0 sporulation family protein [Coriobacteriia bacterium]|nr:stage 0 sporulation family protein [Coriobacteriia bacterium]
MPTVVGVKLRFAPKTLWFDPIGTTPVEGDTVIVETERGTEIGLVAQAPHEVAASDLPAPLKPILRVATADDLAFVDELTEREREAMPVFRDLVHSYKLDMKPIDVEYLFSGDKVVFYFVAEERVDFRDLVKDLASRFKARIDMRQVGVRDEARMIGGLGHCGEQLCCVRFGGEFQPVSIRMAKEQDLPLNPLKISGLCGRLMCCLRYEFEAYKDYKQRAPKKGAIVETPLGLAKVSELNTPHETVGMRLEDGMRFSVPLKGMECCKGGTCPCSVSREVLEEAGGTGMALALAALDRENEPSPVMTAAPPKPRRPRGGEGAKSEEPRQRPVAPAAEPAVAGEAPARKRRRRGGRGGAGGAEAAASSVPEQTAPKPAAQQAPPSAEAGGEGGSAKPGRRRRRRRPGSGGGAGSGDAPTA